MVTPQSSQPGAPPVRASGPPRRVLVLDENSNLRYLYIQALHEAGYEAYPAATRQEARDLLLTYPFAVLVADTHLEGQDEGASLLAEQAAMLAKHQTKVIIISSQAQYRARCEELGADLFLEKPIAINRLVELVHRLLANAGERDE